MTDRTSALQKLVEQCRVAAQCQTFHALDIQYLVHATHCCAVSERQLQRMLELTPFHQREQLPEFSPWNKRPLPSLTDSVPWKGTKSPSLEEMLHPRFCGRAQLLCREKNDPEFVRMQHSTTAMVADTRQWMREFRTSVQSEVAFYKKMRILPDVYQDWYNAEMDKMNKGYAWMITVHLRQRMQKLMDRKRRDEYDARLDSQVEEAAAQEMKRKEEEAAAAALGKRKRTEGE